MYTYRTWNDGERYLDVYDKDSFPTDMSMIQGNAVIHNGYVLPFRKLSEQGPGMYQTGMQGVDYGVFIVQEPETEEEKAKYDEKTCINFSDKDTIREYMRKKNIIMQDEMNILTNVENRFKPIIHEEDSMIMKGFKKAIQLKNMDIESYKTRFGSNYNNDRRCMEKDDITLNKAREINSKVDIVMDVTFRNKPGNIANPMSHPVTVTITDDESFNFNEEMEKQDQFYKENDTNVVYKKFYEE